MAGTEAKGPAVGAGTQKCQGTLRFPPPAGPDGPDGLRMHGGRVALEEEREGLFGLGLVWWGYLPFFIKRFLLFYLQTHFVN
jgi:hypothetical protein